jgi:hypothetical protein
MATQLKSIVRFTDLAVGVPATLPHSLNINGVDKTPDLVAPAQGFFDISADSTGVTVTRQVGDPTTVDVYCETWHSMERTFGPFDEYQPENLEPRPFILRYGWGSSLANAGIMRTEYATPVAAPIDADSSGNLIWGVESNAMTVAQGMVLNGSIIGLYLQLSGPIGAGQIDLEVDDWPLSVGPAAPTGAILSLVAPSFVGIATFARGTYAYNATDALSLRWTTDAAFDAIGPAIATLIVQAD